MAIINNRRNPAEDDTEDQPVAGIMPGQAPKPASRMNLDADGSQQRKMPSVAPAQFKPAAPNNVDNNDQFRQAVAPVSTPSPKKAVLDKFVANQQALVLSGDQGAVGERQKALLGVAKGVAKEQDDRLKKLQNTQIVDENQIKSLIQADSSFLEQARQKVGESDDIYLARIKETPELEQLFKGSSIEDVKKNVNSVLDQIVKNKGDRQKALSEVIKKYREDLTGQRTSISQQGPSQISQFEASALNAAEGLKAGLPVGLTGSTSSIDYAALQAETASNLELARQILEKEAASRAGIINQQAVLDQQAARGLSTLSNVERQGNVNIEQAADQLAQDVKDVGQIQQQGILDAEQAKAKTAAEAKEVETFGRLLTEEERKNPALVETVTQGLTKSIADKLDQADLPGAVQDLSTNFSKLMNDPESATNLQPVIARALEQGALSLVQLNDLLVSNAATLPKPIVKELEKSRDQQALFQNLGSAAPILGNLSQEVAAQRGLAQTIATQRQQIQDKVKEDLSTLTTQRDTQVQQLETQFNPKIAMFQRMVKSSPQAVITSGGPLNGMRPAEALKALETQKAQALRTVESKFNQDTQQVDTQAASQLQQLTNATRESEQKINQAVKSAEDNVDDLLEFSKRHGRSSFANLIDQLKNYQ
jgi:hypothetical protein